MHPQKHLHHRYRGFTLAELLIALAILGVIATFTIPKVLQAQASAQKKAVFKEVIATIASICHQEVLLTPTPSLHDGAGNILWPEFLRQRMNYLRTCNGVDCYPPAGGDFGQGTYGQISSLGHGFLLQNGAYLSASTGGSFISHQSFFIDANGSAGPNLFGDDIVAINICLHPKGTGCIGLSTRPCKLEPSNLAIDGPILQAIFE